MSNWTLVLGLALVMGLNTLWLESRKRYPQRKPLLDGTVLVLVLIVGGILAVRDPLALPVVIGVGAVLAVIILIWWIHHRNGTTERP